MAKWVIRRSLSGLDESLAELCLDHTPLIKNTGLRTVDDCIASMLKVDEQVQGRTDRREIRRGATVVGYIHISDSRP